MVVIALGQALLAFNFAALSISMGGMVASFETPPTPVGTAIILHVLAVSAFILLGAKLDPLLSRRHTLPGRRVQDVHGETRIVISAPAMPVPMNLAPLLKTRTSMRVSTAAAATPIPKAMMTANHAHPCRLISIAPSRH